MYLHNCPHFPALKSITKRNCCDYTASTDRTLLMHQKRWASGHVTSQAGKHVVNVMGSFCNSTCESKKKFTVRLAGFRIRRRSLSLSVDVQLASQYNAQERLACHTQYWVLCASKYRYSVGGRLSITVDHKRCWTFPAASARNSQRTLSHFWRPVRARYHESTRLHVQCLTYLSHFN